MSDKRVVFEQDGVRVLADGKCEARWASGEWRPYNDNIPAVSTLARALAESEAKVARLARENSGLRDMAYGCGCWGGYE